MYCTTRYNLWLLTFHRVCFVSISMIPHWRLYRPGLYSLSGKASYRQISWRLEAARLDVILILSLWNLTGISAAVLPRCLSNFRAIGKVLPRISRLREFTRSCGKTSVCLVNKGHGRVINVIVNWITMFSCTRDVKSLCKHLAYVRFRTSISCKTAIKKIIIHTSWLWLSSIDS